jgi:hypothetical protein
MSNNQCKKKLSCVLRDVIFPDGGEDFDGCGVLDDLSAVDSIGGDTPGIAGASIVLSISDFEQDMAFDKVAGLLEGVAVFRQDAVFIEKKFGHKRALAKTKRLLPDSLNGFFVTVFAVFAKYHYLCLKQSPFNRFIWPFFYHQDTKTRRFSLLFFTFELFVPSRLGGNVFLQKDLRHKAHFYAKLLEFS